MSETNTRKTTAKKRKKDEQEDEKHCICDNHDYTTLMICCDYCMIWYHVKCMGVTKAEADNIEKYGCKPCHKKDSKQKTIYKKGTAGTKKGTEEPVKKKVSNSSSSGSAKREEENKSKTNKKIKEEIADEKVMPNKKSDKKRSRSGSEHRQQKPGPTLATEMTGGGASSSNKDEAKKARKTAAAGINNKSIKTAEPFVAVAAVAKDTNEPVQTHQIVENSQPVLMPNFRQQLQESHPELRCGKCIGCFRDKDCEKCPICLYKTGKICVARVCVQIEELFKANQLEKERPTSNNEPLGVGLASLLTAGAPPKGKKGRKPKQEMIKVKEEQQPTEVLPKGGGPPAMRKRRHCDKSRHLAKDDPSLIETQLNKIYNNWIGRHKSKRMPPEGTLMREFQCYGPQCTNSARIGSKYCSEECGVALAQIRLKMILPQRFNAFFETVPNGQALDMERLNQLEKEMGNIKSQLACLEEWKENVHQFVEALKNAQPSNEKGSNEEENLVIGCSICAGEFPLREITKHTQSCFVRSERQTTYGTEYRMPKNQYKLYCEAYNKINKTFCKRLRYSCAEHYKEEYDLKICGCPLNWKTDKTMLFQELFSSPDAMVESGYCQERRKACRDHQNWIQTTFSLIDNERMNLVNKQDELFEQKRVIADTLFGRGDVLSLLCTTSSLCTNQLGEREDPNNSAPPAATALNGSLPKINY